MIEKAIVYIRNSADLLLAASEELRESARDCGKFISQSLLDEAEEAEKLASLIRANSWGNHLQKMAKRTKK